ncbi:MAG: ComEC/Rec2 family competence protein [Prevotella sp.]|nr:ComEC/Rec2 family competence protein [Prevotella sp.]
MSKYPMLPIAVALVIIFITLRFVCGIPQTKKTYQPGNRVEMVSAKTGGGLWLLQYRDSLLVSLRSAPLTDEAYSLVSAMALGEKSVLGKDMKDAFRNTGTSHLLALSGLHMGIIMGILLFLFKPFFHRGSLGYSLLAVLLFLPIWIYVFMVGAPISVVRSAVMISICIIVSAFGRRNIGINTLATAAVVILCISPESLFEISFQLSFLSVLGIMVVCPVFNDYSNRKIHNYILRRGLQAGVVSLSAQIATLPLVLYYFGNVSPYSVLTNLVAIPLVIILLWSVMVAIIMICLSLSIAIPASMINFLVCVLLGFLRLVEFLPYATISGIEFSMIQTLLLYAVIAVAGLWWKNNNAKRSELLLLTVLTFILVTYLC